MKITDKPIILGRYSPSQNGIVVSPFGPALCLAGGVTDTIQINQRYLSSTIKLDCTSQAEPRRAGNHLLIPINVCTMGTASSLTARMWKDAWTNYYSLGHYPSTAVLVEYEL